MISLPFVVYQLFIISVGLHKFNLRIFNLRVSNPNELIVYVFLTRCRISMCQGLGPKKHDEISEIDRNLKLQAPREPAICIYIYKLIYIYIYIYIHTHIHIHIHRYTDMDPRYRCPRPSAGPDPGTGGGRARSSSSPGSPRGREVWGLGSSTKG